VARNEIKRGQILKPDDMVWQVWPEGGVDKSYVMMGGTRTPDSFAGWVARNPISGGEPITESKIVAPGNRGFLAAVLRPGMRAASVQLTATSGISGFVFPGDQVDVLITYTVTSEPDKTGNTPTVDHRVAETILHDIRVVAIDQKLEQKPGEVVVGHTATLEVTPKQGEIIALASEMGKLSLTLRSLVPAPASDTAGTEEATADASKPAADSATTGDSTYTVDSEVSALLRPLNPTKKGNSNTDVVTILRGGGKGSESVATQPASTGS
jgi:pilus assembly protein CpaB